MAERAASIEHDLLSVSDGEESRRVTMIEGESLAVMEVTSGPLTEVAYGTPRRGHKMLFAGEACARVLGVEEAEVLSALGEFFSEHGGLPVLTDLMDRFDVAGERYTYTAWGADGNAAYRPS